MRSRNLVPLIAIGFSAVACLYPLSPAAGQSQMPPAAGAFPPDSNLDALLSAKNWNALGAALSQPVDAQTLFRRMNWLHTRINAGGGLLLVYLYTRDLWFVGGSMKVANPEEDSRTTAGMMVLYAYELILIDGAKCADPSAQSERIEQLFKIQAPVLSYLRAQPAELKAKIVDIAIALEKKTAALRNDDVICRAGLEQMRAGIERGTQHEIQPAPGQFGKTVAVEPPPDWAPRLLSPELYQSKQDKARSEMRAMLSKLVG